MKVEVGNKSGRHFEDFLGAYYGYAKDNFCPDKFHYWAGISLLAGAMERKVWLNFQKIQLFPNMFIMLISKPGMGKSTAGNRAVNNFLAKLQDIIFVPQHVTEAKMVDTLSKSSTYQYGGRDVKHSSLYWYMSEASNSLKELSGGGDIVPAITDFYDCPAEWSKATMKDGERNFTNICLNILAGCTFDFLNQLIMGSNVFGGFASRNLYIVHDELMVRNPVWDTSANRDFDMEEKLLEDLKQIHNLKGPFKVDTAVKEAFKEWFPKNDRERQGLSSLKLQAFLVRRHTNILKLCMIFSVSENNDLIIRKRHWDKALHVTSILEKNLPAMIAAGEARGTGQKAIKEQIINMIRMKLNHGEDNYVNRAEIYSSLIMEHEEHRIESAIKDLDRAGILEKDLSRGEIGFFLSRDPQDKL